MTKKQSRRRFLTDSSLIAGTLLAASQTQALVQAATNAAPGTLRVGAYVMDVTPPTFPIAVNGYFSPRYFEKANDPTCARVIMVDDGKEQFVFMTLDVCLFPTSFSDKIKDLAAKKTGIAKERISISATHTHFGPGLFGEVYTKYNAKYIEWLIEKSADAIAKAKANAQPAKFGWTTAREERHVFCRRFLMKPGTAWDEPGEFVDAPRNLAQMNPGKANPNSISRTGVPDQTIYILAFETLAGRPLALLANYSTHYAGEPQALSADYFGVFAKRIKEMLGADDKFVAMMTNGTSGDTNCIDFLDKDQPKFNFEIVGEHVAERTFQAYGRIKFQTNVAVRSKQEVLKLANRRPTAKQLQYARDFLAKYKDDPKVKVTTKSYAQRTLIQETLQEIANVPIQAVQIGDFGICTIPNEVFSFTGHDLRAYSPFEKTIVISLANGYNGYLPTSDQFELGGYTTWRGTSYLEYTAEPKIRAALLAMLKELAKKS